VTVGRGHEIDVAKPNVRHINYPIVARLPAR
jgi:hypothetical protein